MRLEVDEQADALYLSLREAPAGRTEEVAPGVLLDYNEQGQVVGVEMLYLSQRAPGVSLRRPNSSAPRRLRR